MATDRGTAVARSLQGAGIGAALLALLLALPGCSGPTQLEVLRPTRGDLERSFTEQARTRLTRTFPVTMPVAGHLSRVTVKEGDAVRAGQILATVDLVPLDARVAAAAADVGEFQARTDLQRDTRLEEAQRSSAVAQARAEAEVGRALRAQVRSAEADLRNAKVEQRRSETLFQKGFVAQQEVDAARLATETAAQRVAELRRRVAAQDAAVAAAERQVSVHAEAAERRRREEEVLSQGEAGAQARLREAAHEAGRAVVKAPVAGVVLRRFEQGPGEFAAGARLLEIGRLQDLEVVADVLTGDALGLKPGMAVSLRARDGDDPFEGVIREIEPAGFTKLSSLGVEQQRVEVVVRLPRPPKGLGEGYRVAATFVTGARRGVLLLPRFAVLQDDKGGFQCFVVEDGRLVRRQVELGLQGDAQLEVVSGVREGDVVVAVPDTTLKEGQRVSPQTAD